MRYLKWTAPAVAACAALGTLGTKPDSPWYQGLKKPSWQPPAWLFAPAWTTIYSLTALASARTLERLPSDKERRDYAVALGANLALNTAFTWVYFVGEQVKTSVAVQAVLEVSTLDLIRRSATVDRASALMLTPYAAWGAFALALNADIARRN
ncbi:TspO/MBR family protein [Branchiibius cervicis]|uniref:TspO/MBR family protein n=1 Tax=Branchiibius cervicis TaxID=908252 RepID=A0ABW2AQ90_9MICO